MTRPKILIVDDEPFNVDYLEQELEDADYETIAAVNGQDALDKVQREAPDLILLDIMMPVMDGFEVLVAPEGESSDARHPSDRHFSAQRSAQCGEGHPVGSRGLPAQTL